MKDKRITRFRRITSQAILAATLSIILGRGGELGAEVTFDGTLGAPGALVGPDFQISADRGTQVGSNLFHSFYQFTLNNMESATFNGTPDISNVISRVTGGNLSSIDGRLNVAIPKANLYLINPAGVVLGPNATLNIDGAFNVSTAHYLLLGKAGRFDATNPQQSVLTVGNPVAYGFLDSNISDITLEGAQLQSAGYSMSITAGDINVKGATVNTQGGDVRISAVSGKGTVTIGQNEPGTGGAPALSGITITDDSQISTSGGTAGSIYIRGGRIVLDSSRIVAGSDGNGEGGAINVTAKSLAMNHRSELSTSTTADARAGDIRLNADSIVRIENGSVIESKTLGDGDAGDIDIRASRVELLEGGRIESTTGLAGTPNDLSGGGSIFVIPYSPTKGNSGNITVSADTVILSDSLFWEPNSFGWYLEENGQTALLDMIIKDISDPGYFSNLSPDQQIAFDTAFDQWARNWRADTSDLRNQIARENVAPPSGIVTSSFSEGDAGNITLAAGDVSILGRAQINSRTDKVQPDVDENFNRSFRPKAESDGGDIQITADSITIRSHGRKALDVAPTVGFEASLISRSELPRLSNEGALEVQYQAGINADARHTTGHAGSIKIEANEINIGNGAKIRTMVNKAGAGGNISLLADRITLNGSDSPKSDRWAQPSTVTTETVGESGDAGSITVSARQIDATDGFVLSASTHGVGNAGEISISGGNTTIADRSAIKSITTDEGNAGNIEVTGKKVNVLDGATISSSSNGSGDGGSIALKNIENIHVSRSRIFADTAGSGSGGAIVIGARKVDLWAATITSQSEGSSAGGAIRIEGGDLRIENGTTIRASNIGDGDAGTITLTNSGTIRIHDSEISTEALAGGGGNITLLTNKLLELNRARLSTSVLGSNGSAGNIFIDPKLVLLTDSSIQANAVSGTGGDIRIHAGLLVQDANSLIEASSEYGIDGTVVIDAPVIQLQRAAKRPKKAAKHLLRNRCKARDARSSSFTVITSAPIVFGPQASLVSTVSDIDNKKQYITGVGRPYLATLGCSE